MTQQPATATPLSLSQQMWAVNDALQQRIKGYPALIRKGELRQTEADYRVSALTAAFATLSALDTLHRTGPVLAPAQVDLFKAWQELAAEDRSAARNDMDAILHSVSGTEAIAIARLLRDLATLARRSDLVA